MVTLRAGMSRQRNWTAEWDGRRLAAYGRRLTADGPWFTMMNRVTWARAVGATAGETLPASGITYCVPGIKQPTIVLHDSSMTYKAAKNAKMRSGKGKWRSGERNARSDVIPSGVEESLLASQAGSGQPLAVSREPNIGEAGLLRRGGSGKILLLGALPACGRNTPS